MQRAKKPNNAKGGMQSIENFFFKTPKKVQDTPERKRKLSSSSDEAEVVPESPLAAGRQKKQRKEDDGLKSPQTKKPALDKLKKAVDPSQFFGNGDVVRVEGSKKADKKKEEAPKASGDEDISEEAMEVERTEEKKANGKGSKETIGKGSKETIGKASKETIGKASKETIGKASKETIGKEEKADKKAVKKEKISPKAEKSPQKESDEEKPKKKSKAQRIVDSDDEEEEIEAPKATKKPKAEAKKASKAAASPRVKKEAASDLDTSVLTDEERFERKRWCMMNYQKFKNRPSVLNPGSKEVPKGKPNCLNGLNFLITGVLESLERDETDAIIKEYGGKTMKTLSKKLTHVIAGEDAGPAKLAKAEEFNIPVINEDEFFDIIRERSGLKKETKVEAESPKKSPPEKKKIKEERESPVKKEAPPAKKVKVEPGVSEKKEKIKVEPEVTMKTEKIKQEATVEFKREPQPEVAVENIAWVDKYKPTSVKDIIGQHGPSSNVNKLMNWLSKWYANHDGKNKPKKPSPWAKNDDGSFYKAALLSGPPGIGKTTTATLVCKELGFDTVEFNASDTRSKRLLKEEVAELLSSTSLYGFCHGQTQALTKKHVLIMDEVDGMAGNEDRGGVAELIALIKDSQIPIICMCNDRNHQKMRSLVNYCYDLRFNRPQIMQIKAKILGICFKEKFKLEPAKVEEIIAATNNDIRQSINHIALMSAGKELQLSAAASSAKTAQKDMKIGAWDVVRKVFSAEDHKTMSFNDKSDLFFHDYSLGPLFVQHNYLRVTPTGPKKDIMSKVAATADALSLGDLVERRIRSNSAWSMLPTQAAFSSVLPGEYMSGHFTGRIDFPGWLGKNSKTTKRSRLAQEIHDHTRLRTSASRQSIRLDYAPFLLQHICKPMIDKGNDGVKESLEVLKEYHLLREDVDSLVELATWPGKKSPMDVVNGRVKASLTRSYNKEVLDYSYSTPAGITKKKKGASAAAASDQKEDPEVVEEEEEEELGGYENY